MKINRYTFLGAFLGLIVGGIIFIPTFGVVFGLTFFIINAILSLLQLTNGPTVMPFFYSGMIAGSIIFLSCLIGGLYWGTKYGNSR